MVAKVYKGKGEKLLKFLEKDMPELQYSLLQKLLRKKDIKINGKRVNKNVDLSDGDLVELYVFEEMLKGVPKVDAVYQDDNIIIVNKPAGIEVENDTEPDLTAAVKALAGKESRACHRLDRNTKGLVIFAKNQMAYAEICEAIKKRKIQKFYLAQVFGKPKNQAKLKAFLFKDAKSAQVFVSDTKKAGFVEIKTNYRLLENFGEFSLLEVELITGKTHQIRAHLAHVGLPIVGDNKYGDTAKNKSLGKKRQELTAFRLVFNLDKTSNMAYLNDLEFKI